MKAIDADGHAEKMNQIIEECLSDDPNARPTFSAMESRIRAFDPYTGSDSVVDNMAVLVRYMSSSLIQIN